MTKLKVLDLFSGIGGFSLGLERTGGFETVAFCEIEEFPRRILAKHWPEVPCYHDVRELTADVLRRDDISVDVICGGFPCQDLSAAGRQGGISAGRSGLWSEIVRLIGEMGPRFAIVENVTNLLLGQSGAWFATVLSDLAALGYDAEWHCIPASSLGLPHGRDRVWIVAYPHGQRRASLVQGKHLRSQALNSKSHSLRASDSIRLLPHLGRMVANGSGRIKRNDDGFPRGVDRLKGCGNAVVPQIPEMIGRAILEAERAAA